MDDYSQFNGTSPISPTTNRVSEIQKRRKTDDRPRQKRKKNQRGKDEEEEKRTLSGNKDKKEADKVDHENEDLPGYGPSKPIKRGRKKVDLTI